MHELIPPRKYPDWCEYCWKGLWIFNPETDDNYSPFLPLQRISCPHCGGPTRKHYHDPQGPRRVFGFESDFWAMGIQYQCLGQGTADSKCSNRRNTRGQKTYYFFDTLDRAYLDTLPESIVLRLPLVLLSSFTLVQREFMNMISKAGDVNAYGISSYGKAG